MTPQQAKVLTFFCGSTLLYLASGWDWEYVNWYGQEMFKVVPMTIGLILMLPLALDMAGLVVTSAKTSSTRRRNAKGGVGGKNRKWEDSTTTTAARAAATATDQRRSHSKASC